MYMDGPRYDFKEEDEDNAARSGSRYGVYFFQMQPPPLSPHNPPQECAVSTFVSPEPPSLYTLTSLLYPQYLLTYALIFIRHFSTVFLCPPPLPPSTNQEQAMELLRFPVTPHCPPLDRNSSPPMWLVPMRETGFSLGQWGEWLSFTP